jgi:hypothetical protein
LSKTNTPEYNPYDTKSLSWLLASSDSDFGILDGGFVRPKPISILTDESKGLFLEDYFVIK